jgi:hypothetical protein
MKFKTAYNFCAAFVVMFVVTATAQLAGAKIINKITFK